MIFWEGLSVYQTNHLPFNSEKVDTTSMIYAGL
jgi:hypothetical protein